MYYKVYDNIVKVFMLIYTTGCSTGYKELIGVYSSVEKAEAAKLDDMHSPKHPLRGEFGYYIREVEIDKELNHIFTEW